jgi:hypothetical protein
VAGVQKERWKVKRGSQSNTDLHSLVATELLWDCKLLSLERIYVMEHQDFETTQVFPAEVGLEDSIITPPWQSPSGNSYEQPNKVEEIMSEFNAELQYVIEQGQTRVGDIYNEYMILKREIAELDADIRQEKRCTKKRKEHTAEVLDRAW